MNSDGLTFRTIEWGPLLLGFIGAMMFLLGVGRFVRHGLSSKDALYCCLALVPAWVLLLVIAYVIQHSRPVAVIPLFLVGLLAFSSRVFDVAFGLVLIGMIVAPALSDRRSKRISVASERSQKERTTQTGNEEL